MHTHTPGPWTAYCRDVNHKEGEPWPKVNFLQWEVSGPEVPDGRGEFYEADARLIAAAPDLLEALELARDHIDMTALEVSHCKDAERIRLAIAKARGELFSHRSTK